jgi:nitroreductase
MVALDRLWSERGLSVDPRVAGFHRAQEVGSRGSRVHPVSWRTDPLRGTVSGPDPVDVPDGLARWTAVLDAACGYEARPDHPRGMARRVPSAGALYPIELFTVGAAGAHQYVFLTRRFHAAHAVDVAAVARTLGLGRDDLALIAVADFWRTVQRYGVRGYRYCLLDAAHVMNNLVGVIGGDGSDARLQWVPPSARLTRALALPRSVGMLRALIVRRASRIQIGGRLAPAWTPSAGPAAPEQPPLLCPLLERVVRFHAETQHDVVAAAPAAAWRCGTVGASAVAARRSAKSFTAASLPDPVHAAIVDHLRRRRSVLPVGQHILRCYGARVRVAGAAPGLERIDQAPEGRTEIASAGLPPATAATLAVRVRSVCQDQALAGEAAYVVMIGLPASVLRGAPPADYRDLVSEVGHLGAELGLQAAALGVGTTMIGGFYDAAAQRLVADQDWFPIAIQLYGESGAHGRKIDATSRVGESRAAGPGPARGDT